MFYWAIVFISFSYGYYVDYDEFFKTKMFFFSIFLIFLLNDMYDANTHI